jgi:outer membrane translocation and assembly module TamA
VQGRPHASAGDCAIRLRLIAVLSCCGLLAACAGTPLLPSVSARAAPVDGGRAPGLPTDAELESAGARVGAVDIVVRDVFDFAGGDEDSAISRLANRLHIRTRQATVADQLLFRSGDAYRARLLEESARSLRGLRYLRDARVKPVAFHDGIVDVQVNVQDVWTFNPGVSYGRTGGVNSSGVELEELNLLGTGIHAGVGATSNVDRDSRFANFRDPQLGSSRWDLALGYADTSDGEVATFGLDHPFYSLDTRLAGGVRARDERREDSRYDLGEVVDRYAVQQRAGTIYLGRSPGLRDGWARRYSYGFSVDSSEFSAAASGPAPRLLPADRKLSYPWVETEWIEDAFQTVRNRDQIEKTEDYLVGLRARLRVGYATEAFGADRDAWILSAQLSQGIELDARRSLFLATGFDGRLESGTLADGVLLASARYYSRQSMRRVFYAAVAAAAGFNPDADRQFLLGGDNGLRGYPLRYHAGEGRWQVTIEQRFFSDWFPFQLFNVGGAVFVDVGSTWGRAPLTTPPAGVLKDIGLGLRLGNSRSALGGVVHIDVAFPLGAPDSIDEVQFLVQTKRSF